MRESQKIVEKNKANVLWEFFIQIDKQTLVDQSDIVIIDKNRKAALINDIEISNDRKKNYEKLEKYQGKITKIPEK